MVPNFSHLRSPIETPRSMKYGAAGEKFRQFSKILPERHAARKVGKKNWAAILG
jgi:hypothetical protein